MEPDETGKPSFIRKNQETFEPDSETSNSIRHWLALYRSRVYELCYPIEQPSKEKTKGYVNARNVAE